MLLPNELILIIVGGIITTIIIAKGRGFSYLFFGILFSINHFIGGVKKIL